MSNHFTNIIEIMIFDNLKDDLTNYQKNYSIVYSNMHRRMEMSIKVLNAAGMKAHNQKRILNELRISPKSRAEMARQIGLTRSGIGVIVDHMIDEGILMEGEFITGKVGRTSVEIQLNPDIYCIAGVNIARDCCSIGMADFNGNIKQVAQIELVENCKNAEDILDKIYQTLFVILKNNPCKGTLLGIGITCPGPLDVKRGKILNPPNFLMWENIDIVNCFRDKFKCPVFLENNANALALAEKYFGIGGAYKNYIEIVVDTGIGGGIILDGKLYKGENGFGSDFGHTTVNVNGELCSCGNIGCVELYASITNVLKYANQIKPDLKSWKQIVDLVEQGDKDAEMILEREAKYLAATITTAMNILDVESIIMAGDITYKGDIINQKIEEQVNRQFFGKSVKKIKIVPSRINTHANILSCINLVLEHFIQSIKL